MIGSGLGIVCQSGEVGISELMDGSAPRSASLSPQIRCEGLIAQQIDEPCITVDDSGCYLAVSTSGKMRVWRVDAIDGA